MVHDRGKIVLKVLEGEERWYSRTHLVEPGSLDSSILGRQERVEKGAYRCLRTRNLAIRSASVGVGLEAMLGRPTCDLKKAALTR